MKVAENQNFIETTKTEFQCYQKEPITDLQAIEIQKNLFGVVNLLIQWNQNVSSKNVCISIQKGQ